jgi:hypothetical protein
LSHKIKNIKPVQAEVDRDLLSTRNNGLSNYA